MKKKNIFELQEEKTKLHFEFWDLKEKAAKIYQEKRKIHSKYCVICRKISDKEKRVLEIMKELQGEK